MKSNLVLNQAALSNQFDRTLKATALIYLEEALRNERYEECAQLIRNAQRFGAKPGEITSVIGGVVNARRNGRGRLNNN